MVKLGMRLRSAKATLGRAAISSGGNIPIAAGFFSPLVCKKAMALAFFAERGRFRVDTTEAEDPAEPDATGVSAASPEGGTDTEAVGNSAEPETPAPEGAEADSDEASANGAGLDDTGRQPGFRSNPTIGKLLPKQRALVFIAGYLWDRGGAHNEQWELAWQQSGATGTFSTKLMTRFRLQPGKLTKVEWASFRRATRYLMAQPEHAKHFVDDYGLLSQALEVGELASAFMPNVSDLRIRDQELLKTLELQKDFQKDRTKRLLGEIGGIWHVIRKDTSEAPGDDYNVSLLSIKPLEYIRAHPAGGLELVRTHVPHFSLRSRGRERDSHQEFRGIVVSIDDVIYFLATRENNRARLVLMTWPTPPRSQGSVKPHADSASGTMITVNASGQPIATPLVAQFIDRIPKEADGYESLWNRGYVLRTAERLLPGRPIDFTKKDEAEAEFWGGQIETGKLRAKRYSRLELDDLENFSSCVTVKDLVHRLDDRLKKGERGYFD